MSLRTRTVSIIGNILAGLVLILLLASQTVFLRSFEQLEEQNTHQDVQRVFNALQDYLTHLSSITADYASWDDTYAFIEDANEDYIQTNLVEETFANLDINLMAFVNLDRETVFSRWVDLETATQQPLPEAMAAHLAKSSPLFNLPDRDSTVTGIVMLPEGPILVASRPIQDSLKEQEPKGTLIFGRYLNEAKLSEFSDSLRLPIEAHRFEDTQLADDVLAAKAQLSPDMPVVVRTQGSDRIAGYGLIADLYGNPALIVHVDLPRDIYARGQASISFFAALLIVAGFVLALATVLLIDRTVLSRLTRLSTGVRVITSSSNLAGRVEVAGNDELSGLGNDINRMLLTLEQTQRTLRESDERLRTVVKSAPVILLAFDRDEKLTLVEGRDLKALGLESDPIGKPLSQLKLTIALEVRRALAGEETSKVISVDEYTFDARFTPLRDASGSVVGAICIGTNITERIMAEEALGVTQQSLEQQKRLLDRARVLFRSTLDQLTDTVHRGAEQAELASYLDFVRSEFDRLD